MLCPSPSPTPTGCPLLTFCFRVPVELISQDVSLDSKTVGKVTNMSVLLTREFAKTDIPWQEDQCFTIGISSPYSLPGLYEPFIPDGEPDKTFCEVSNRRIEPE